MKTKEDKIADCFKNNSTDAISLINEIASVEFTELDNVLYNLLSPALTEYNKNTTLEIKDYSRKELKVDIELLKKSIILEALYKIIIKEIRENLILTESAKINEEYEKRKNINKFFLLQRH